MQISGHYAGFPEKTTVLILNHERGRIFFAHKHEFNEEKPLINTCEASEDDENLRNFFQNIYKYMEKQCAKKYTEKFLICIPEVHRPLFEEHLPSPLKKSLSRIVPKNLSAMEEGPILRILFEG